MTHLDTSPGKGRSSLLSELGRRCSQKRHLQKRYVCFGIVAALFPFTLLRLAYLSNVKSMGSQERLTDRNPSFVSIKSSVTRDHDGEFSTSHSRAGIATWTRLREGVSSWSGQLTRRGTKILKEDNGSANKPNGEQPARLTEDNEETGTSDAVNAEKLKDKQLDEYLTTKDRTLRTHNEMPKIGHSSRTQDEGYVALPEDTDKDAVVSSVMPKTKQVEDDIKHEEKQDVAIVEEKIPSRNLADAQDQHDDMNANDDWRGRKEERSLVGGESNETEPIEQMEAEEQKVLHERIEAEFREDKDHQAMEITEAERKSTGDTDDDHRREAEQKAVAEREAQHRIEEKVLEAVEAVEEKNWEEEKEEDTQEDSGSATREVTEDAQSKQLEEPKSAEQCDLFEGDWEWDPEGPLYTNSTCFYMQSAQNCMSNGRQDTEYLHWKWKPRGCDLPRFDARAFLEAFKGKTIGFVGDSLSRNQMQSLLCMLSQIEVPRQIYQSHDDSTVRWLYEQHQVILAAVWSPYLLKESKQGVMGLEKGRSVLYLDVLDDEWTSVMQDFDILVLSIGQWYFQGSVYVEQDELVGCNICYGLNLTHMSSQDAYQSGLRQVLGKVASEYKGIAIMSTFAISHFEDGEWDKGGHCDRKNPLSKEEGEKFAGEHNMMHDIVIREFNNIAYDESKLNEAVRLEFLDVTKVSLTRADGHPGPYRKPNPFEGKSPDEWLPSDCLHWCLPGPVDTWNELLVKLVNRHL